MFTNNDRISLRANINNNNNNKTSLLFYQIPNPPPIDDLKKAFLIYQTLNLLTSTYQKHQSNKPQTFPFQRFALKIWNHPTYLQSSPKIQGKIYNIQYTYFPYIDPYQRYPSIHQSWYKDHQIQKSTSSTVVSFPKKKKKNFIYFPTARTRIGKRKKI